MDSFLEQETLDEMFELRDKQIERVHVATETRKRFLLAKSQEEFETIQLPEEFRKFGEYGYHFMMPYVSGYSLKDEDEAVKCFYGVLDSPVSLFSPILFRGEIMDYGDTSGYSSLGRYLLKKKADEQERYLSLLKAQMRIELFAGFLSNFRQFTEFPFAVPRPELIAQHYGLNTQFLDLTDDIKVAMFFATCQYDGNNEYRPITEQDIEKLGRYGVLYVGAGRHSSSCIGFQPFCRCHRQRGYYLDTTRGGSCWSYSLSNDGNFHKFYFKRTVELSERLCEEFKRGAALFPRDELSLFEEQISIIKNTQDFPIQVFEDQFVVFMKYLFSLKSNGLIHDDLFSRLNNKDAVKSLLETQGASFKDKFYLKIGEEKNNVLKNNNDSWDPEQFAEADGFVYSPFIVLES